MKLNLRKELVKCHSWNTALYDDETWTLYWRRTKISWTDHMKIKRYDQESRRTGISYIQLLDGSHLVQSVPLATEPGISLIILTSMKILQRNLNRRMFVV